MAKPIYPIFHCRISRTALLCGFAILAFSAAAVAAPPVDSALDWRVWRTLPVQDSGRVMPLDTLARMMVESICGQDAPCLSPPEADSADPSDRGGAGQGSPLFPGGRPRRFSAPELIFSWLVEPDQWEQVPFLEVSDESLRRLLDLPLVDSQGRKLEYVSPGQFARSPQIAARREELALLVRHSREMGREPKLSKADRQLERLEKAYHAYRALSYDPRRPKIRREVFLGQLVDVAGQWRREMRQPMALWRALDKNSDQKKRSDQFDGALQRIVDLLGKNDLPLPEAQKQIARLREASDALAESASAARRAADLPADDKIAAARRRLMKIVGVQTAHLSRQVHALAESLYENGRSLDIAPSVDRFALSPPDASGRASRPWLSLAALLFGSDDVVADYPPEQVGQVRKAFEKTKAAYLDRPSPNRSTRFAQSMWQFSEALRELAQSVEPRRRELASDDVEIKNLLNATAYPSPKLLNRETFYNRLDPFFWSWVFTLAAVVCLALGWGRLRGPAVFAGAAMLILGQAATIAGLGIRASITGMVPITNMYETVLFVGLTVALLGFWFAMLPILWSVLQAAWGLTAVAPTPHAAAAAGLSGDQARWFWRAMPVFRFALGVAVFVALAIRHWNPSQDAPIFPLVPPIASATFGGLLGGVAIWLVGLGLLIFALWLLPRVLMALVIALLLLPRAAKILLVAGLEEPIRRTVARRPFLLAGAAVALLAYLAAYYAPGPVFHREIGLGMAILRTKFWLVIHVLIITASYGAGALAWGLANISLGFYALGRYRAPLSPALPRRPPAICAKLSGYIYKTLQIAVLLLAAGTITGAIWADVSWGRFWSWDPKEVAALISLFVYLVLFHARGAGWAGHFGTTVGAVLGATAILLTWYWIRIGLHAYGQAAGGEFLVQLCLLANWLLVALAAIRYWLEKTPTAR